MANLSQMKRERMLAFFAMIREEHRNDDEIHFVVGITIRDTRLKTHGIASHPSSYIRDAYRDWYFTQTGEKLQEHRVSWLLGIPQLYSRRAPGATCMHALGHKEAGSIKNR